MIHDDLIAAGITMTPEQYKARHRAQKNAWRAKPENMAREKARRATPEYMERERTRERTPESRARDRVHHHQIPIEIPNHSRPADNRCECCGEISEKTLHLDHCHETGRFRGWCCHGCNTGTGRNDDSKWHRLRALYLDKPFQAEPTKWVYPKGWPVSQTLTA